MQHYAKYVLKLVPKTWSIIMGGKKVTGVRFESA